MPLFGSKKDKSPQDPSKPAYPTQAKPAYPTQAAAAYGQSYGPPPPHGFDQPPPYTPVAVAEPRMQSNAPSVYAPASGHPAYPPMGFLPSNFPAQMFSGPPQTVIVQGGFDAGARFDGSSGPNIPPPPPGCAPNAAQMASAYGHNVVVTQQKSSVWSGGSDGGASFF